jgi:hypothetical protein
MRHETEDEQEGMRMKKNHYLLSSFILHPFAAEAHLAR